MNAYPPNTSKSLTCLPLANYQLAAGLEHLSTTSLEAGAATQMALCQQLSVHADEHLQKEFLAFQYDLLNTAAPVRELHFWHFSVLVLRICAFSCRKMIAECSVYGWKCFPFVGKSSIDRFDTPRANRAYVNDNLFQMNLRSRYQPLNLAQDILL